MNGWIKLHRQLLNSAVFQNEKMLKVWVWCLLKATHDQHEAVIGRQKVMLEPGQFIFGRKKASLELNMPETTIRDYINLLKFHQNITIKSTNKYSVVTVVNWALYQTDEEKSASKSTNKSPTNGQQMDTNKNVKNGKNGKEVKKHYAEYVRLTEEEYRKLTDKFGQAGTQDWIERLNLYKGSKGKKYASDYLTILNWAKKEDKHGNKSASADDWENQPDTL